MVCKVYLEDDSELSQHRGKATANKPSAMATEGSLGQPLLQEDGGVYGGGYGKEFPRDLYLGLLSNASIRSSTQAFPPQLSVQASTNRNTKGHRMAQSTVLAAARCTEVVVPQISTRTARCTMRACTPKGIRLEPTVAAALGLRFRQVWLAVQRAVLWLPRTEMRRTTTAPRPSCF